MNLVDVLLPLLIDHFLAVFTPAWPGSGNFSGFKDFLWPIMLLHVAKVSRWFHWFDIGALWTYPFINTPH